MGARVLVHTSVYKKFMDALVAKVSLLFVFDLIFLNHRLLKFVWVIHSLSTHRHEAFPYSDLFLSRWVQ
jgi:hypothetical protein